MGFDEKGADTLITFFPGMSFAVKDACPEKCGNPCAHAPTEDVVAGVMKDFKRDFTLDCPGAKAAGLCESDLLVNWFCGESCRGGGPWDECMWHKSARQQIDDDCAKDTFLAAYGYTETEACEADNVANYLGDSKGTCPGDPKGEDCYYDSNLFAYGSTQVAQCPGELDPFRRRKLTRSGTHSGAMKTKGVFTLTASGSK